MSQPSRGGLPRDVPFGSAEAPFGAVGAPFGSAEAEVAREDAPADPGRNDSGAAAGGTAAGAAAADMTKEPLPVEGPVGPQVPIIPDPPAPGTVPPPGVPFTGPDRTRHDPGLRWTWLAIVVGIMAVGVVLIALGLWQAGSCLMGAGMIVGALMRLSIPSREIGLLRVRGKAFDVLWMLAVGTGIIAMVLARS